MAHINAYLNFNGNARAAMLFYNECFGGELVMQKIAESPMAVQMPAEMSNHILHSTLTSENFVLMASDMMSNKIAVGNNVTLCLQCGSDEEINLLFKNLCNGGKINQPLQQSYWGATFGELIDKFDICWILNHSKK